MLAHQLLDPVAPDRRPRARSELDSHHGARIAPASEHFFHPTETDTQLIRQFLLGVRPDSQASISWRRRSSEYCILPPTCVPSLPNPYTNLQRALVFAAFDWIC
jgi:hypothetical protein